MAVEAGAGGVTEFLKGVCMLIMMIVVVALMMGSEKGPMGMMMGHEKPAQTDMSSVGSRSGESEHDKGAAKGE